MAPLGVCEVSTWRWGDCSRFRWSCVLGAGHGPAHISGDLCQGCRGTAVGAALGVLVFFVQAVSLFHLGAAQSLRTPGWLCLFQVMALSSMM